MNSPHPKQKTKFSFNLIYYSILLVFYCLFDIFGLLLINIFIYVYSLFNFNLYLFDCF